MLPCLVSYRHKLRIVDLSYNNLTALPETIFMRTSLEIFSAAYNQLKEIPVKALNPVQSTLKKVSSAIEVAHYFDLHWKAR